MQRTAEANYSGAKIHIVCVCGKEGSCCSKYCLLSLFNQSTLPADIISVQMEGELIIVSLNDLLIDHITFLESSHIRDINDVHLNKYPHKSKD